MERMKGKGAATGLLTAGGLALLLASCGVVQATARAPQLAVPAPKVCGKTPQNAEQVFRSAREGVAVVSTGSGVGSAFVVAQQNGMTYLVTNAHVVGDSERVRLKWVDGRTDAAEVVVRASGESPSRDLALLAVAGTRGRVLELREQPAAVGQEVFVIGAPKGLEFSLSRGVVSSLRGEDEILQIDAAVNPGNSGGPVLDAGNCVAGVATFKFRDSEGLNFAISAGVVRDFLAQLPAAGATARVPESSLPEPGRPAHRQPERADGGQTVCTFQRSGEGQEQLPCRLRRVDTRGGTTVYELAWADGARNAYAFFGDGRVAIRAEDGRGRAVNDEGVFRTTAEGVAIRSSGEAIAFIPGLDPVLN